MIVDLENHISLIEIIKGILPSELKRYCLKYLETNTYIKSSKIAYCYLNDYYNIYSLQGIEYDKVMSTLIRKFAHVFRKLIAERVIEKYNTCVYKKVVIQEHKTIEPTLSQHCRLIFRDGSFKNPKFIR